MFILLINFNYCIAKSLQLCLTLCDPLGCSPPGSSVHGILQARILDWIAISYWLLKVLFKWFEGLLCHDYSLLLLIYIFKHLFHFLFSKTYFKILHIIILKTEIFVLLLLLFFYSHCFSCCFVMMEFAYLPGFLWYVYMYMRERQIRREK